MRNRTHICIVCGEEVSRRQSLAVEGNRQVKRSEPRDHKHRIKCKRKEKGDA